MKTSIGRGVTSVLVLMAFLVSDLRLGYAYPGDVFRVSTPAQAPSVEDRLTSEEETHSVGKSGTAHYTIPITVAPGRQGMQPSVSLSYSSRNPVRGGLAAGWMLTIPKIEVDTSQGRLEGTFYRSSLSGTRLVPVPEQAPSGAEAFRAEFDGTYARYERVKNPEGSTRMWLVHTTDGRTWFFGEAKNSQDAPRSEAAVPAPNGRWFLSKIVDRFGNSIEYTYAQAYGKVDTHPGDILQPVDIYPIEIKWGGNSNTSLQHHARVVFDYGQQDWLCPGSNVPIGASFTYRMGYRLHEGAKRLGTIKLQVMENNVWHERRRYVLGYDMEELTCPIGRTHAPLRLLTSVRQTATATDGTTITTLLPVTFEYGRRELELTQKINSGPGIEGHNAPSYAKAGGWPTVDRMLLDFDGDGRLDGIGSDPTLDKNGILCGMGWSRNKGDGTFEKGGSVFLPTVPWAGRKRNDAPPLPESFGGWNSDEINAFREQLNTREGCSLSHQFSRVDGGSSKLQGGVLLSDQAGFPATYNSYRFMDVTGDGRPDLVTAIDTNRGKYHPESDTRLWPPSNPHPACFDYGPCRSGREGFYLTAEGGGGREVKADRRAAREWETFTLRKIEIRNVFGNLEVFSVVNGPIGFDEPFALQAHNGAYVVVKGEGVIGDLWANSITGIIPNGIFKLLRDSVGTIWIKAPKNKDEKDRYILTSDNGAVSASYDAEGFRLIDLNGGDLHSGDKVQFRTVRTSEMCWVMAPIIKTATVTTRPTHPGITSPQPEDTQQPRPTTPGIAPVLPLDTLARPLSDPIGPGDGGSINPNGPEICPVETCPDPSCAFGTVLEGGENCRCNSSFCGGHLWNFMASEVAAAIDRSLYKPGKYPGSEIDNKFPNMERFWDGPQQSRFGFVGQEVTPVFPQGNQKAWHWPEFSCGRNVLRVYENTGSGFVSQAKIVYSPIPLETDRETSALGAGHLAASSSWHGFLDIDGDGFLDAVYNPPVYVSREGDPAAFKVFRGDGTGNFHADVQGNPYEWPVPDLKLKYDWPNGKARVKLQSREKRRFPLLNSKNEIRSTRTMVTLQDMNGDGLPDYVDARFSANGAFDPMTGGRVHVFYNTGRGFVSSPATLEVPTWGSEIYRAFEETQDFSFQPIEPFQGDLQEGLWSRAVAQVVDIDVDGLPDLVLLSNPLPILMNPYVPNPKGPSARLFVNVGDKLVPMGRTDKTDQWWSALARITISHTKGPWTVYTDFVDLDGDGLPEARINSDPMARCVPDAQGIFGYDCVPEESALTSPRDGQGMRLLRKIDNGRGGTVQFDYQPLGADSGGRVPYPLWVVKSVTANAGPGADGIASVPSTTEYSYQEPVYNQDHHGDWGFRGFTSVKMKSPSGAVRFTNYDYTLHWGGLPVGEQILDSDNGRPHRISKSVWSADPLFNNKIITHHRREVETRTCQVDQTVQTCATNGDPRVDLYQWDALASNIGPPPVGIPLLPLLYVKAFHWAGNTRNAESTAGRQGRKTHYHLLSTPTEYRLLPQEDQRYVVDPQPLLVGKTLHQYDGRWLVELETIEYPDPNPIPQSEVKTVRTYDLKSGNLLTVTRPNQVGTPNPPLKLDYDSRQLFVIRTTNKLGHQVDATYDLGTGVQLSSRGPNAKGDIKEGWERTIDGFGRVLEEKVAIDHPQDPTQPYRYEIIARNEYHDDPMTAPAAFLNGHAGFISRKLIEFDENRWTTTATEVDGLGRVVVTKALAGQAPLALSRFFYDAADNLVKADLPAPNKAPGSETVSYTLTYDPQSRRISALRPDQTGQRWMYDGRSTTREDVVTNDRDVVSRTRTLTDVFDRLIRTEEQLTNGDWALTSYGYDGNDNVKLIRNADGIETGMEHDWLSRRVQVIRGGQTWGYGYDKNGNMISIVAPTPPNVPPADFITTITYDALDRPETRVSGSRVLSSEKLADYGPSSTTYEYDKYTDRPDINAIGRLTKVSQPHGFMEFTYEARGLIVGEKRGFSVLGGKVQDTRTMTRTFNALGALKSLAYADAAGANAPPTTVLYTYDDRGFPLQAQWAGHNGVLGQAQYTASGLVALRSGKLDDSIEHQTTYIHDDLGRTTQQLVKAKPHNGQVFLPLSEQRYSYTGSDDVATWDTTLGAGESLTPANWTFGYDAQHQLTQATGPLGYQAAFAYSPGGRIMSANVNVANTAKRVHRRAVTYDYTPFDPEAPDVLKLPNGQAWMTMQYDEAGNLSERTIGGKPWTHIYDGADLQREVVRPDGTRELYWYDHGRQRSLIATMSQEKVVGRVRWVFGETEIWYDRGGKVTKTRANVSMNGMLARIEDRNRALFLFQSPRGDVLLALDQQWQPTTPVAADFAYGPYGELLEEKGTESKQVLERFNGKQFDQTSELAYYGYRYYDERSLSWTQADPLYRFAPDIAMDQPRRFATYSFSLNNPLRYLDPNGLSTWSWVRANVWIPVVDPIDEFDAGRTWDFTTGAAEMVGGAVACASGGGCVGGAGLFLNGFDDVFAAVTNGRTFKAKAVTNVFQSERAGDVADLSISLIAGGGAVKDLFGFSTRLPKRGLDNAIKTAYKAENPTVQKALRKEVGALSESVEAGKIMKFKLWMWGGVKDATTIEGEPEQSGIFIDLPTEEVGSTSGSLESREDPNPPPQ